MKVKVFAKLNLILSVGEKQGEFHHIDSVATSVDICDIVEVVPRADSQVNVCGVECVEKERNTAYKAAVAFRRLFASKTIPGVDIFINKGIPFGGGLGGSSADSAAVVYCMCKLAGVNVHSREVHELCSALGSDINFMLFGGLARLQGKGDDVTFHKLDKPLYFALTTFDVSMSSGEVYSAFDAWNVRNVKQSKNNVNAELLNLLQQGANDKVVALLFNDLQQATMSVNNYAKDYLSFIKSHNLSCNMTGSGSAFYVPCLTKADAERVADLLNTNGFTTTLCTSVPNGIVELQGNIG